jgi:hypothetical protein
MESTISQPAAPTLAFSPQERTERLAALGPERLREAMFFLSGFAPPSVTQSWTRRSRSIRMSARVLLTVPGSLLGVPLAVNSACPGLAPRQY